jgi:hypothetical protein
MGVYVVKFIKYCEVLRFAEDGAAQLEAVIKETLRQKHN